MIWTRSIISLIVIALLIFPESSFGWGNEGHEAVACFAWKHLSQATKDKVYALLQDVPSRSSSNGAETIPGFKEWSADLPDGLSDDQKHMYVFMRAATWADSIKHRFLHDSDTPPSNMDEARANIGFTDPDSHGYWHFVDSAFGTASSNNSTPPEVPESCWVKRRGEPPAPPSPISALPKEPVPNATTEIVLLTAALSSNEDQTLKAYDMIWLEHLVGDIHQPLHASVRFVNGISDVGANCVAVKLTGDTREHFTASGSTARPPAELHAFWDDLPGVGGQMDTQPAVDYAMSLAEPDTTAAAIQDPSVWAAESLELAKRDAYMSPIGPELGAPDPYAITTAYYAQAASDAKKRIALAGSRLANLLTNSVR